MQQVSTNQKTEHLIPGGWTSFRKLDSDDVTLFEAAIKDLQGVEYTPLLVSTQVVQGMNYRFLCDSKVVYPGAEVQKMMVHIYRPLEGAPKVTAITPLLEQNSKMGGWSEWVSPVDAESQKIFNIATEGLLGVKYTATAVSKQVVAGMNYLFKCNAKVVSPDATEYKVMMEIYQGPGAEPVITSIIRSN